MKRTRFADEQIIGNLNEHEAGAKCADLCCNQGMTEGTFYNWKTKFGGMTVLDATRLMSAHQKLSDPFKLARVKTEPTSDDRRFSWWQMMTTRGG